MKHAAGILLVRDSDRALFLVRRAQNVPAPGLWAYPGGSLEPGETPWIGACREFREEIGGIPPLRFQTRFVAKMQDARGTLVYTTFVCSVTDRDARRFVPQLNWESDRAGWFRAMPRPLHPEAAVVIDQIAGR